MKDDPSAFPTAIHGAPWPDYELVLEQPADFDRTLPGEPYVPKPLRRRAIHIKCAKADVQLRHPRGCGQRQPHLAG